MKSVLSVFGLVPRRIGGIESFARELSAQLQALGWRSVLAFTGPPTPEVERYLRLPNVSLEIAPELADFGPRAIASCAVLLGRYRPDIFHFHFLSPISPFPWLARLHRARKVFFTDHASWNDELPRKAPAVKRWAGRLITFPMSGWLCVSRYNLMCSSTAGYFPSDRFHVLHNAVALPDLEDADRLARLFRQRCGIPPDCDLVVQVGSLIPEKGVDVFLRAAHLVLRSRPATHFALVGDGSHAAEYRQLACTLEIERNVAWTGLLASPSAEGVYAAADAVCLASRWQEASGLVVIEGMSFGRPVVASAVGGISDAVEDGHTGYLVPRADPQALAGRLLEVLGDPELRRRMGARARAAVEAKFELSAQVRTLLKTHYGLG